MGREERESHFEQRKRGTDLGEWKISLQAPPPPPPPMGDARSLFEGRGTLLKSFFGGCKFMSKVARVTTTSNKAKKEDFI